MWGPCRNPPLPKLYTTHEVHQSHITVETTTGEPQQDEAQFCKTQTPPHIHVGSMPSPSIAKL